MANVCFKYLIVGRVQGVWFRSFTKRVARNLGITGWVRNTEEGGVEILACGDEKVISEFEEWLQKGPPLAKIKSIHVKQLVWQEYQDFDILV